MLAEPLRPGPDGVLRVPSAPGLGIVLDEAAIATVRRMTRRGRRGRPPPTGSPAPPRSTPRTELFIDGGFVPAASGRTFDDIAGRDGSLIARVAEGGAEDVDRAVAAARRSFDDRRWSDQPPAARKRVLLRLAELVREHLDELALLESLDVGKPIRDTLDVDVPSAATTPPVVRRDHRQAVRRGRPDRARTRCRSSPASRSASSRRSCPGTTR